MGQKDKHDTRARYFKIVDKNDFRLSDDYILGKGRTLEETKKILNNLNVKGKYEHYTMVEI
ncbi:hypothetical protein LCGC14_1649840 [marine sediment metagenome]|uniref:Uncharacterized protein n=1 Tax=marine sediment metagenome TaxID=412755 RepID=A0A0F9IJP5_9ZZZZ